jgi:hypothetical protein
LFEIFWSLSRSPDLTPVFSSIQSFLMSISLAGSSCSYPEACLAAAAFFSTVHALIATVCMLPPPALFPSKGPSTWCSSSTKRISQNC